MSNEHLNNNWTCVASVPTIRRPLMRFIAAVAPRPLNLHPRLWENIPLMSRPSPNQRHRQRMQSYLQQVLPAKQPGISRSPPNAMFLKPNHSHLRRTISINHTRLYQLPVTHTERLLRLTKSVLLSEIRTGITRLLKLIWQKWCQFLGHPSRKRHLAIHNQGAYDHCPKYSANYQYTVWIHHPSNHPISRTLPLSTCSSTTPYHTHSSQY